MFFSLECDNISVKAKRLQKNICYDFFALPIGLVTFGLVAFYCSIDVIIRSWFLCIDIGSIWGYWLADLRVLNALPVCWSSWCWQLFLPYHNVCGPWWCTVCKFLTCIHIHIHWLYSCFNSTTLLVCLMLGKYRMVFLIYENDHFDAADGLTPLNK